MLLMLEAPGAEEDSLAEHVATLLGLLIPSLYERTVPDYAESA